MRAESLGSLRQRAYFPNTLLCVDLHGLRKDFVFILKIPGNSIMSLINSTGLGYITRRLIRGHSRMFHMFQKAGESVGNY